VKYGHRRELRHPEVRASSASLEGCEARHSARGPSFEARKGAHLRMTSV
jgi:hypothetical protein